MFFHFKEHVVFDFFRNKEFYILKLTEYLLSLGYIPIKQDLEEIIPTELYRKSKFSLRQFDNPTIGKRIELLLTVKYTIASFTILNLNHNRPNEQYSSQELITSLSKLYDFHHFDVFGFEKYGKKELAATIKLIEANLLYLTTSADFPTWDIEKYPGHSDLFDVKINIEEVMQDYGYLLKLDASRYNPSFTKHHFVFRKGDEKVKFKRVKSRDENYIFAVKDGLSQKDNFFSYGTYEPGKRFRQEEWSIIKKRLRLALEN